MEILYFVFLNPLIWGIVIVALMVRSWRRWKRRRPVKLSPSEQAWRDKGFN